MLLFISSEKYLCLLYTLTHSQVKDADDLLKKMGCQNQSDLQVKVISIFGNTGEGKSHTLNQIFFRGAEVFP